MAADLRVDWQPAERDRLLLQAVLLPDQPARAAWQAWSARVNLDDVGGAAFHLLPDLYHVLASRDWPSPDLARLKGISRKIWYENQLRQSTLQALLTSLSTAGIRPLLLQGAIQLRLSPSPHTARNNSDMACAVSLDQAQPALEALTRLGWQPAVPGARPLRHWPYLTGTTLCPPSGTGSIRLAWRLPLGDDAGRTLPAVAQRAEPTLDAAQVAYIPSPTDRLWLACLEGVVWRPQPDWRWMVDAVRLIHSDQIDWAGLRRFSLETATILPMRAALDYLALAMQAPVPANALNELHAAPTTTAQAQQFALVSRCQGRLRRARRHWHQYSALTNGHASLLGFVHYLEANWSLGSSREVLVAAARRGLRRLQLAR